MKSRVSIAFPRLYPILFWTIILISSLRWMNSTPNSTLRADENATDIAQTVAGATGPQSVSYQSDVLPILEQYCFGCHAEGAEEGNFSMDDYPSVRAMMADKPMWWSVLKNVRADVMPPEDEDQPSEVEKRVLMGWINRHVFSSASGQADPGPNTLRRLNRLEYRNTIRDLMGIDFDTSVEFPPDDSGDGFDNNADALTISPLLAEKYLDAARNIVDQAVPKTSRVVPVDLIDADEFEVVGDAKSGRLSFASAATVSTSFHVRHGAKYRITVPIEIDGSFDFNPGRATVRVKLDARVLHEKEYGWETNFVETLTFANQVKSGDHSLEIEIQPVKAKQTTKDDAGDDGTFVKVKIPSLQIEGPLDTAYWCKPDGYGRFFHLDDPPEDAADRNEYAAEVLRRFCARAYRRPVDEDHLDALLDLAGFDSAPTDDSQSDASQPAVDSDSFEQRISRAMTAVLASPRFLFRVEQPRPDSLEAFPEMDDYSLAARLSYFLWSTMPDEELFRLAEQDALRSNLSDQVDRMLRDERSDRLIKNFVGQWLQTRDVESVSIDPLAALGLREEYDQLSDYLESTDAGRRQPPEDASQEHLAAYKRYREIRNARGRLDADVRRDMAKETERMFSYVLRENRSIVELIESDYAFLNRRLAKHYDLPEIEGDQLRKVQLPPDSVFGGVLTQGTFLLVTSNPTRTSPVKRGLFILDNILGTPAPPAPAMVPELEESAGQIKIENPTLRQLLELHRSEALCRSCHARFDPLGLAFENFSAIGTWRDSENGQPIEPGGRLISGESFDGVKELKQVLAGPRRQDFYRCLSERMLSYAIGRSLDFRDEVALEKITLELEDNNGKAKSLIDGVVTSVAFTRIRRPGDGDADQRDTP